MTALVDEKYSDGCRHNLPIDDGTTYTSRFWTPDCSSLLVPSTLLYRATCPNRIEIIVIAGATAVARAPAAGAAAESPSKFP